MRRVLASALLVCAIACAAAADGPRSPREALLGALSDDSEAVREDASRALASVEGLTEDEVRAALRTANWRAKPLLLRVAAARGMTGLQPEIVAALQSEDLLVADAAVRALVTLGDESVAAGLAALSDPARPSVRSHLVALQAQASVERALVARWRRKDGTYTGRYAELAKFGWDAQPVLLAMLLDVPLSDHHVAVPDAGPPEARHAAKRAALESIFLSNRRGYTTFEPLPHHIPSDDLFYIAAQALRDVADLDLMGDILDATAEQLRRADDEAGWRLRRPEEAMYHEIYFVLFARGRTERLLDLNAELAGRVEQSRAWLRRGNARQREDLKRQLSYALSDHASVLHQIGAYDQAAEAFAEIIAIAREQTEKDPAIAGYNRACALARGGRTDEAIVQLARSLDPQVSSGTGDLTREWVTEDGDLQSLHEDPRFAEIIKKRFGP